MQAVLEQGWRAIAVDVARGTFDSPLVHFLQLDVTDEAAVTDAIKKCETDIGPLTGVVNSAGIGNDVPCLDTSAELMRKILDVNLVGSFLVARAAALAMKERGRDSIVNIASVSSLRGNRGRVAYGASKAGVINMTQVLAVELVPLGIRVNAIAPGPIETPSVAAMHTASARSAWIGRVPQNSTLRLIMPVGIAAKERIFPVMQDCIRTATSRRAAKRKKTSFTTLASRAGYVAAGIFHQRHAGFGILVALTYRDVRGRKRVPACCVKSLNLPTSSHPRYARGGAGMRVPAASRATISRNFTTQQLVRATPLKPWQGEPLFWVFR